MRRSPPAASACARCWCCSAPGPTPARAPLARPRPRSSSSTWRRWFTTTSSTRRRCGADARPWSRPRARPRDGRRRPAVLARVRRARRRGADHRSDDAIAAAPGPHRLRASAGWRCWRARRSPSPSASSRSAATPSISSFTPERYLARCLLKTARLFECACAIGRDDPAADEALTAFGREIGLAFQLSTTCSTSGPARAHRQGARHGPPGRHRDAAADRGDARGPLAGRGRPARAGRGRRREVCEPDRAPPARWTRSARTRARGSRRRSIASARRRSRTPSASCWAGGQRRGRALLIAAPTAASEL